MHCVVYHANLSPNLMRIFCTFQPTHEPVETLTGRVNSSGTYPKDPDRADRGTWVGLMEDLEGTLIGDESVAFFLRDELMLSLSTSLALKGETTTKMRDHTGHVMLEVSCLC